MWAACSQEGHGYQAIYNFILHQQPQEFCATISALYQCVKKCSQAMLCLSVFSCAQYSAATVLYLLNYNWPINDDRHIFYAVKVGFAAKSRKECQW